jgi:ribosomal protein L21E
MEKLRMKTKETAKTMSKKIAVSALFFVVAFALSATRAHGQEMKYKVGDRVEVDVMQSSDPKNAEYRKATIVGIDDARPTDKAYLVQIDGEGSKQRRYIVRDYTKHWIRGVQGGEADAKPETAATQVTAKPEDANQPAPANAQSRGAKYKEGDRVEVDIIQANDPAKAIWKKGTITKVDTSVSSMAYTVRVDPLPGKLPTEVHIPIRPYAEGWLRPLGGAGPQIQSDKLRVDENNTVFADRELLDCKNLKAGPARNGQPPPVELAKKLIRCLYEKSSDPGQDGATTMDIVDFAPGTPHRWNKNEDTGAGGTINTLVYPFRVKWNQKTFYRTYNQIETGNERVFTCYVDVDKWYCGSAQFIKDGEKKQIPVQK